LGLARRYRRQPQELPALWAQWRDELQALNAASDLQSLEQALFHALSSFKSEAQRLSSIRQKAAPRLSLAVTQAMQQLGMAGGKFVVELSALDVPQSWGMESVEFLVAGHEGSTPRPLVKVASGGELSRIALAISVTTASIPAEDSSAASSQECVSTLIFDEVDSGVGGAVADTVGRLMKQLGKRSQVLAVTHLPQVAACADQHFVVSKKLVDGQTRSNVQLVQGEGRVTEIARMLGGLQQSSVSLAHAQEMLQLATAKVQGLTPAPKSPRGVRS
jgi:DNA repair protein RecN (Recombination protein N)